MAQDRGRDHVVLEVDFEPVSQESRHVVKGMSRRGTAYHQHVEGATKLQPYEPRCNRMAMP